MISQISAPKKCDRSRENGFTLIELLITLIISTTILLLAIPLYQNVKISIQKEIVTLQLAQDLKLAKNLAGIEERYITLCGTTDGQSCVDAKQYEWSAWMMFYDDERTFIPDGNTLIHYYEAQNLAPYHLYIQTTRNIGGGINMSPRAEYAYGMARSIANGRINLCGKRDRPQTYYPSMVINVYGYSRADREQGTC